VSTVRQLQVIALDASPLRRFVDAKLADLDEVGLAGSPAVAHCPT
jgi:hypothetical protein